jgi:hypothetical protein
MDDEIVREVLELFPVLDRLPESVREVVFPERACHRTSCGEILMRQNNECIFHASVLSGVLRVYKPIRNRQGDSLYRTGPGKPV